MFTAIDILRSSFIIQTYYPFALVPVTGHLAANADISAKQTAAFTVPVLSDIKKMQLWTATLHVPENLTLYVLEDLTLAKYNRLLSDPSGIMKAGAQGNNSWLKPLSFTDLLLEIRKKNKKRLVDAVMEKTNPGYNRKDKGTSLNCQRCVLVFIRLLRGEDYCAYPSPAEDKYMNLNTLLTVMKNPPDLNKCIIKANNKEELIKIIESKMKEAGEGSVAVIGVHNKNETNGHLFNAAQVNDETWIVDAQKKQMDYRPKLDSVDYSQNIIFFIANDIEFNDSIFNSEIGIKCD